MFCREQVAQLRDVLPEIRRRGADLVIVGNGAPNFAAAFREDLGLDGPLLVDPSLESYAAAGLQRSVAGAIGPSVVGNAVRALWGGARQGTVQGDAWQLGGVFVIRGGEVVWRHASSVAGDHPDPGEILGALGAPHPEGSAA